MQHRLDRFDLILSAAVNILNGDLSKYGASLYQWP
jgi:hypothetical protein